MGEAADGTSTRALDVETTSKDEEISVWPEERVVAGARDVDGATFCILNEKEYRSCPVARQVCSQKSIDLHRFTHERCCRYHDLCLSHTTQN